MLDNIDIQSIATDAASAAHSAGNQTLSGDIEAGISGAAEGAVVAAVVGEVAVVVGAAIVTGDVAAAVGIGVAAGASIGEVYGPIGAAVGAVIGVLVALFGKPGPTAFQTRGFEGTSPIKVFQGIVAQPNGRLCIEVMQDVGTAVAFCTWAANDDFTAFDAWVKSFVACDTSNGAVRRLVALFATGYQPTKEEYFSLARVVAVIQGAHRNSALAPGDDQAVQVLNALDTPSFAMTVIDLGTYTSVTATLTQIRGGYLNKDASMSASDDFWTQMANDYGQQVADQMRGASDPREVSSALGEPQVTHFNGGVLFHPPTLGPLPQSAIWIHPDGTQHPVTASLPRLSFFERALEWVEYHIFHVRPKIRIPGAVKGGVFGNSLMLADGNEVIDSDYAQHSTGISDEDRIQMWLSDPVRSTIAFDLGSEHVDEDEINAVLDDPSCNPELNEALACIEGDPQACPIAAIGVRIVRMKRACETMAARACAGDKRAEARIQDAVNRGGVLGRIASDCLILAELQPLQEKAMSRQVSLAPHAYPIA
jgi:hypothetical protein